MTNDVLILVVEDEALIEELVVSGLEDAGYTVVAAQSAEDAIALLEQTETVFRAVVTDVNLVPHKLTGWDVARRARELTADIPVVYMSGASGQDWTANGVPNSMMIAKPFVTGQIVTAVSHLLNASGPVLAE
uniref:response regulator n=1 Tax=uncultured Sphingomonas sp. TaxID=158754 RepID=UPI0035C9B370